MIGVSFGRSAGWLHEAAGHRGVILCSAHGFEELCARRSWRALAESIVAAGMPALRFDYDGTADADGTSDDPARVRAWRQSLGEAVRWFKDEVGVTEVVLVGLRAGALLAALEAESEASAGLAGLALLAPVLSGRQYMRETQVLAKIMAPPAAHLVSAEQPRPGIDVCGFWDAPETIADFGALVLEEFERAPASNVLLLPQKGLAIAKLRDSLVRLGASVTEAEFVGYDHMICDPTASEVPHGDIERIVAWALSLGPVSARHAMPPRPAPLVGDGWSERGVTFGPGLRLAGILTTPDALAQAHDPVIFINAGMSYHIGWARMTVDHARALARLGVPSLRIDFAGVGDSAPATGTEQLPLYNPAASDSLTAAVDWLVTQGYGTVSVVGACSGAYTAFHGIRSDARITQAAVVNLQCFHWTPSVGYELERWKSFRRQEVTAQKGASEAHKGVIASVRSSVRGAAMHVVRKLGRTAKTIVRAGRRHASTGLAGEVEGWFKAISGRGARVLLVYSEGDTGLGELEHLAGPRGAKITSRPGISLQLITNADHNLTPVAAREALLAHLIEFLAPSAFAKTLGATAAAAHRVSRELERERAAS